MMRKMTYVLTNGERVNTWTEAVRSGQGFAVELVDIPEPTPELLPKQRANRKVVKAH